MIRALHAPARGARVCFWFFSRAFPIQYYPHIGERDTLVVPGMRKFMKKPRETRDILEKIENTTHACSSSSNYDETCRSCCIYTLLTSNQRMLINLALTFAMTDVLISVMWDCLNIHMIISMSFENDGIISFRRRFYTWYKFAFGSIERS